MNALSFEEEVFFRRLMSVVDDYGRCEAHPGLLRAALYPLKLEKIRETTVERLICSCEQARLIRLYTVAGKRYLEVFNFGQQTRSKSKCPKPDDGGCLADDTQIPADDERKKSNAHLVVSVSGDVVEDVVGDGTRKRGADRPLSVDYVVAYFIAMGSTEIDAQTFFDHFEANGWRQGGRALIRSWQAAARNWIRRGGEFGGKNSSGGGSRGPKTPEPPFNPELPNAHTGGVPVAN